MADNETENDDEINARRLERAQRRLHQYGLRKKTDNLRLYASDVAAICGFNPYKRPGELLYKYIYSGFRDLLGLDAANLGVRLVTEERALAELIDMAPSAAQAYVAYLVTCFHGQRLEHTKSRIQRLRREQLKSKIPKWSRNRFSLQGILTSAPGASSVAEARKLTRRASAAVATAVFRKELSEVEAQVLQQEIGGVIAKEFGTNHEATALAKYMEMTGSFVEGNNEQQYCIPVEVSASASFTVIGYVDGFVDLPRFEDIDGNWNITRRVVEIKNRVRKSWRVPPPFYEQIQLIAYMKMLDAEEGDLVQCVVRGQDTAAPALKRHKSEPARAACASDGRLLDNVGQAGHVGAAAHPIAPAMDVNGAQSTGAGQGLSSGTEREQPAGDQQEETASMCCLDGVNRSGGESEPQAMAAEPGVTSQSANRVADMEAVLPNGDAPGTNGEDHDTANGDCQVQNKSTDDVDIHIHRVQLAGMHGDAWDTVIIPRLKDFASLVYSIRGDDSQRMAFLLADDDVRDAIAISRCSFMETSGDARQGPGLVRLASESRGPLKAANSV